MSERDDLTPEEKRALGALTAGPEPPPALEEAVVSRLRANGLIGERRRAGTGHGCSPSRRVSRSSPWVSPSARGARRSRRPRRPRR